MDLAAIWLLIPLAGILAAIFLVIALRRRRG
jgi:phosphate/sulfate permease